MSISVIIVMWSSMMCMSISIIICKITNLGRVGGGSNVRNMEEKEEGSKVP